MKRKFRIKQITAEESIKLDMERSYEERIIHLLRLIRISQKISQAGDRHRKLR